MLMLVYVEIILFLSFLLFYYLLFYYYFLDHLFSRTVLLSHLVNKARAGPLCPLGTQHESHSIYVVVF